MKIEQLHIDVARNATDDFNLFHDPHCWHEITDNPFSGPIVLGFQLEGLIEKEIGEYRLLHQELDLLKQHGLGYSNYQFNFANAVKPNQSICVDIKGSQFKQGSEPVISNRVAVKADDQLVLMGFKKESPSPLFLPDTNLENLTHLDKHKDRSYVGSSGFFLKRKYMMTSNAKNFLCATLTDQSLFFNELNDVVRFPEIFPCSLLSCALLEKAQLNQHDFRKNPMVYTSHKISIDRRLLAQLKSNDALHLLVREFSDENDSYECYGVIYDNKILFRAIIGLAALQAIKKQQS